MRRTVEPLRKGSGSTAHDERQSPPRPSRFGTRAELRPRSTTHASMPQGRVLGRAGDNSASYSTRREVASGPSRQCAPMPFCARHCRLSCARGRGACLRRWTTRPKTRPWRRQRRQSCCHSGGSGPPRASITRGRTSRAGRTSPRGAGGGRSSEVSLCGRRFLFLKVCECCVVCLCE